MKALRPEQDRPRWRAALSRGVVIVVIDALALWLLSGLISGFAIDGPRNAILAGLVVGFFNALIWPVIAGLVVPLSVLTLGVGAIVLNAIVIGALLDQLPGVTLDGIWTSIAVAVGLAAITTFVSWLLAVDDDTWFDEYMARRASRSQRSAGVVENADVPGVVFVQIDGLAHSVLRRALHSADVPTLHRWIREGTHHLVPWETDWSSQTGVSQCGLLHGSTLDMPAFRWVDKTTGAVVVSNHPSSAIEIERQHSDGNGLLAHDGSSYGNLFSGDAARAVLTMSSAGRVKEGRIGAGYGRYFSRPTQAARTLVSTVVEVVRERRAASYQRRRDVEPRVERDFTYALLRAFTTVISRDICVSGVLNDMGEGRSAIYVDLVGYDEVAHHSGPERVDTLAVLRDIDRQIGRLERAARWAPRPYRFVVLSDHGQTQGATFHERYGESLAELVERLVGATSAVDPDSEAGNTESTAWLRLARRRRDSARPKPQHRHRPTVLASGNLGLIYLPGEPRLALEEIDEQHPGLIEGLRRHPGIGFLLVRTREGGSVVLGPSGTRRIEDGSVIGDDPLAVFGPSAPAQVARVDGFTNVADIMLNSVYDPELDEVAAFEQQVSSHGGLGGPQTHPFLLAPADLPLPDGPIEGSAALHRVLKGWLADLGQRWSAPAPRRSRGTAEPAPLTDIDIAWLGHASSDIRLGPARFVTDPVLRDRVAHLRRFVSGGQLDAGPIDAVLLSHLHHDHLDGPSLRRLPRDTPIVVPRGTGRLVARLSSRDIVELAPYEATVIAGATVTALPAQHRGGRALRRTKGPPIGFLVERAGRSVYFAGDTDLHPMMADLPATDVTLLPIGGWGRTLGPGHLDPRRAAQAASLVRTRFVVPIHWGTFALIRARRRPPAWFDRPAEAFVAAMQRYAPDTAYDVVSPAGGRVRLTGIGDDITRPTRRREAT